MELLDQMILKGLREGSLRSSDSGDIYQWVECRCYDALKRIRDIILDDQLSDDECFMKIEHIIMILEDLGSDGGIRHDFG